MIVVIIVGVLATLAVYGVRQYVRASKTSEVTGMITSIQAAEEAYRDETTAYLNVSGDLTSGTPYPDVPGTWKMAWPNTGHGDNPRWMALGVQPSGPVRYGYLCVAGAAGQTPPNPPDAGTTFNWATVSATEPWYVIVGMGDLDGDGTYSKYIASSFTTEVYSYLPKE